MTLFPERCLAFLHEVTKSNVSLGDNKSRGGEGQPERIAIKMLSYYAQLIIMLLGSMYYCAI